ncbi:hypothetical protein EZV76_04105 [Flagellimonas alvinocaridis]|uniref:Uncharacterized protein n=1 Tax=Flagellimonas alvinocaridis TaxID=2530200 RepID=A0A4S8RT92_9FLAO|nr:hypothetical protein [Allomuricauda alvinocaridis]THV61520.1 hypothetical protein EZV76_04105 [Allomuricauda alvinocaridis]
MSEIFILKVEDGASYNGDVYDYWITCKLKNNQEIILFDYKRIGLNEFVNKWVDAQIQALFVQLSKNKDLLSLEGKITFKNDKYYFLNEAISIEVSNEDVESQELKLNTQSVFYFGRLDIIGFNQVKC